MVRQSWTPLFALLCIVAAINVPRQTNDGVHLAITPTCGKLGGTFTNVNAGIVTSGIKTLVAFGVFFKFYVLNALLTVGARK
jgi:hypothetical protein